MIYDNLCTKCMLLSMFLRLVYIPYSGHLPSRSLWEGPGMGSYLPSRSDHVPLRVLAVFPGSTDSSFSMLRGDLVPVSISETAYTRSAT